MNTELYTIYDHVAKEAGPIFQAKNMFVAMRYVNDLIKDNKINTTEYDLVRLGSFDSESLFLTVFPDADAVNLSNVPTYVDDSVQFMKVNASEKDCNEFKESCLFEEFEK